MAKDSLGTVGRSLTTPSESSRSLVTKSVNEKYLEAVGPTITAAQLTEQLTRMNAVFGNPKDRTEGQIRIMANEWLRALGGYGAGTVVRAINQLIETWKFGWMGALAEVVEKCKMDDAGWRDAFGMIEEPNRGLTDWTGRGERFERDGRTTEEEIKHRISEVAEMKREANFNSGEIAPAFPREDVKPASQSMIVSPQARNSCAARRARNEKTCENSCARQHCAMREAEAARDIGAIDSQSPPTASDDFSGSGVRAGSEGTQ